MVWNPALRRWDGNEDILTLFSPHLPSTFRETSNIDKNDANVMSGSAKKPALITQKSLTGLAMVGGGVKGEMVFDPVLMRWIGNEEELDVFDDDEFGMNTNISTLNGTTSPSPTSLTFKEIKPTNQLLLFSIFRSYQLSIRIRYPTILKKFV